jgi:hypothetical protein
MSTSRTSEAWKDPLDCKGTGYVEAPSHSIERSQFGAPDIGVYVCSGCKSCRPVSKAPAVDNLDEAPRKYPPDTEYE